MSALAATIRLYECGGALGVFLGKRMKIMTPKLCMAAVLATAAIAVGALASPVMAKTLTYTFGISGGGAALRWTHPDAGHHRPPDLGRDAHRLRQQRSGGRL